MFLVIGKSESGDTYYELFRDVPSEQDLIGLAYSWDGDSDRDGPGYAGSYVHIEILTIDPR